MNLDTCTYLVNLCNEYCEGVRNPHNIIIYYNLNLKKIVFFKRKIK